MLDQEVYGFGTGQEIDTVHRGRTGNVYLRNVRIGKGRAGQEDEGQGEVSIQTGHRERTENAYITGQARGGPDRKIKDRE
jgi:hypothetical protein